MSEIFSFSADMAHEDVKEHIRDLAEKRKLSEVIVSLLERDYWENCVDPIKLNNKLNQLKKYSKQQQEELKAKIKRSEKELRINNNTEKDWLKDTYSILMNTPELFKARLKYYRNTFNKQSTSREMFKLKMKKVIDGDTI